MRVSGQRTVTAPCGHAAWNAEDDVRPCGGQRRGWGLRGTKSVGRLASPNGWTRACAKPTPKEGRDATLQGYIVRPILRFGPGAPWIGLAESFPQGF